MSTKFVSSFADTNGTLQADSSNVGGALMLRDGSGNCAAAQLSASELKSTGILTLAVHASTTGTATADGTASFWPCDATGGAFTLTLPAAATVTGRIYVVKKTDSSGNTVTVKGNASENIDGANTYTGLSSQYKSVVLISDGTGWQILAVK